MAATEQEPAHDVEAQDDQWHAFLEGRNVDTIELSIHQRMAAILAELPAIGKNQQNTQQGFMFRGHDDVLNALNPLLSKYEVFVVPHVLERVVSQRTTDRGKAMYEVNLHVAYRFYGPAGDYVQASAWGEGTDMGDKSTNKAMTMAMKNVLNQAFAVSTAETIDADAHTPDETASVNFNPALSLLAGAPRGWQNIAKGFNGVDPSLDWQPIIGQAVAHVYGTSDRRTLEQAQQSEVGRRLANVIARLSAGGDFPPPDDTAIATAFAEMFDGAVVEVAADEPALTPAVDEQKEKDPAMDEAPAE